MPSSTCDVLSWQRGAGSHVLASSADRARSPILDWTMLGACFELQSPFCAQEVLNVKRRNIDTRGSCNGYVEHLAVRTAAQLPPSPAIGPTLEASKRRSGVRRQLQCLAHGTSDSPFAHSAV